MKDFVSSATDQRTSPGNSTAGETVAALAFKAGVEAAVQAFIREYGEQITPKRISPAIAVTFIYDALSDPRRPRQALTSRYRVSNADETKIPTGTIR